jgi:hypothetical protein
MRRVVVGTALVFGTATAVIGTAVIGFDLPWWPRVVVVAVVMAALAVALRCRHPHPALQPGLRDELGERHEARWYCDACGRSWAAAFERERAPVLKFGGFDQDKAPEAERRARLLEVRRRELALDRAGLRPTTLAPAVAMHRHRAERSGDPTPWRPAGGRTPLELLHSTSLEEVEEPSRSNG